VPIAYEGDEIALPVELIIRTARFDQRSSILIAGCWPVQRTSFLLCAHLIVRPFELTRSSTLRLLEIGALEVMCNDVDDRDEV
jgi:hypothetical protein